MKNFFCQLLDVHMFGVIMQVKIHKSEPLLPGPIPLDIEITIVKFEIYCSSTDRID
jgi:hypothetical protein